MEIFSKFADAFGGLWLTLGYGERIVVLYALMFVAMLILSGMKARMVRSVARELRTDAEPAAAAE